MVESKVGKVPTPREGVVSPAFPTPKGDEKDGEPIENDWIEKLPPAIKSKVHAVVRENWPTEADTYPPEKYYHIDGKKREINETQNLVETVGKAVSASWSPTQTMIAVGRPESWGIVASVTAPPGWALLGRDLADPEDYTIVTKLHSLTDEEKKKIKESTAKFVNGCKFYASEEGLAEIVEKSTPWVKKGYRVIIITVESGRIYSLKYANVTNQALICREDKLLVEGAVITADQKKVLNEYHAEYWKKGVVETKRLCELWAVLLDGPVQILDSVPPTGQLPKDYPEPAWPKVTVKQVRQEISFDEYKEKELHASWDKEPENPGFGPKVAVKAKAIKEGALEYKDRLVRMTFNAPKTHETEKGCARPIFQAKETDLIQESIPSQKQRLILHSHNKCVFLRAKADTRTFLLEFTRLVTSIV